MPPDYAEGAVEGQVSDAETGEPVFDAMVEVIIKAQAVASGPLVNSAMVSADTTDTVLSNDRVSDAQSWIRTMLPYITSKTSKVRSTS